MTSVVRTLVVLALLLAVATPSRADIGVILLEPIGLLGLFTRVGHAATYLSNVCPDASPVKMRLCLPGERGGVVSRYAPFSEREDYDWAIVPLEAYLHGLDSAELAPIIATRNLQDVVERYNFDRLFSAALTSHSNGDLPSGQWKATLANRYVRSLYIFSVQTTPEDDAAIVDEFNAVPNTSCFNFFYGNCSNQTKRVFKLVLPNTIGDRVGGMTMEAPKGLVKALANHALEHPEHRLRVQRWPQLPGTFPRSRGVLFPMENMYKSLVLAPWWYFGGFREVAAGAIFYHQVISPFNVRSTARAFISPRAASLTREQRRLRQRQDELRRAFASAAIKSEPFTRLAEIEARVSRRLDQVQTELRAEVDRVEGSTHEWHARRREFRTGVRALADTGLLPRDVAPWFERFRQNGELSRRLTQHFESEGQFSIGGGESEGLGPWLSLPLEGARRSGTGISRAELLSGDPRVAVLVLAAAIDGSVNGPRSRRDDLASVDELLALFAQAIETLERDPAQRLGLVSGAGADTGSTGEGSSSASTFSSGSSCHSCRQRGHE